MDEKQKGLMIAQKDVLGTRQSSVAESEERGNDESSQKAMNGGLVLRVIALRGHGRRRIRLVVSFKRLWKKKRF